MLVDGLKLMVIGMGAVFVFLSLMVLLIGWTARLVAPFAGLLPEAPSKAAPRRQPVKATVPAPAGEDSRLTAAIVAAVHRFRQERGD
jgi:oxaloacetate decarboxylase gamma subunit